MVWAAIGFAAGLAGAAAWRWREVRRARREAAWLRLLLAARDARGRGRADPGQEWDELYREYGGEGG